MDSAVPSGEGRRETPLAIAIVGCGPKGLYALESFCTLAGATSDQPHVDVTVYEPTGQPGAGAIYDPSQPDYLRMNFASRFIDAWDRTVSPASDHRPSLVDWLRKYHPAEADPDGFVPRAMVGRYLTDCLVDVLATRPSSIRMQFCFERVTAIQRKGDRWQVQSPGNAVEVDEVLIATGHQDWRRRGHVVEAPPRAPSIASIFPVQNSLGMDVIPAGVVVGCKGFALTWIDAALALTVGRGGVFSNAADMPRYQPGGKEPARLIPLSRTGRPMLCKPDYRRFSSPAPDDLWRACSAAILAHRHQAGSICFGTAIWPEILRGAERALGSAEGAAEAWFEAWRAKPHDGEKAHRAMRSSHQVATGQAPPDMAWALGESWRRTYPAVVACVSHGGLHASGWPAFAAIAREMERIAAGPPALNMGRMLALIDAGLVDLGHVAHFASAPVGRWPADIGVSIDATIPAPYLFDEAGPIGDLLQAGHVERGPGGGLAVDESGRALANGAPVSGLSVVGRPAEGSILGNDTLNRALHRYPVNWARRMLQRAAPGVCPVAACEMAPA